MGTGYTRNDTSNNIADGNIINAADLDGEFDAIESAMGTSGHTHDGTSAEGGPVTVLGPVQDFVASATEIKPKTTNTLDIGTNSLLFKDMFLDGVATIGSIKIDNAGTIGSASDGDAIAISSSGVVTFSQAPVVDVTNSTTNAVTDVLDIQVQSTGTPAVGIGSGFTFGVETAAGNVETGGAIRSITTGLTPTSEEIDLVFYSMRNGSLTEGFRYDSSADNFDVTGSISIDGGSTSADFTFGDNDKAIFGAGSDLQIYAASGVSFIKESGSGNLNINAANFILNNADDSQNMFKAKAGAEVELYFNNSQKLETTSTGVDITGTVTADDLIVDDDTATITIKSFQPKLILDDDSAVGAGSDKLIIQSASAQSAGDYEFVINNDQTSSTDQTAIKISGNGDISFYEDQGTTPKFFWSAATERLGIGVTDPDAGIEVQKSSTGINSVHFANTSSTGYGAKFVGGGNTSTQYIADFRDYSGASKVKIDGSGNVGIGTDSPATMLNLSGDETAIIRLDNSNGSASDGDVIGALQFYKADGSGAGAGVVGQVKMLTQGVGSGGHLTLSTGDSSGNDAERVRITSNGNVGIGTISPSYPMTIHKAGDGIKFEVSDTVDANYRIQVSGSDIITGPSTSSSYTFQTGNTERMRITPSGNVNLTGLSNGTLNFAGGNTSDGSKIQAWNDAGNANGYLAIEGYSSEYMRIDSSGNVIIGAASAVGDLHVQRSDGAVLWLGRTTNSGQTTASLGEVRFGDTAFDSNLASIQSNLDGSTTSSNLSFHTQDTGAAAAERMRIDSSGNVGIGTDSPVSYQTGPVLNIGDTSDSYTQLNFTTATNGIQYIGFGDATTGAGRYQGLIQFNHANNSMGFGTNASTTSALLIDSSGNVLVGKTSADNGSTVGHEFNSNDTAYHTRSGGAGVVVNRTTSDGNIALFQKDGSTVGSIGSNGGSRLYIESGDVGLRLLPDQDDIRPCSNAGANRDAAIDLGDSAARFKDLYLSGGVVFGDAGGSGTSSSNSLDSYEEGTWTPIIADSSSGGNTASSYTTNLGFYTKIGRQVTVHCTLTNINTTGMTSSNGVYVQGLPFSHSTTSGRNCTGAMRCDRVNVASDCFGVVALISAGSSTAQIFQNRDNLQDEILQVSALVSGQVDLFFTLTYEAS